MEKEDKKFHELQAIYIKSIITILITISILAVALFDMRQGKIFYSNPFLDKDWILVVIAFVLFALNIDYMNVVFYNFTRKTKKVYMKIRPEQYLILIIGLYIITICLVFFDFEHGGIYWRGLRLNYSPEDLLIMVISIIGIIKFTLEFKKR